MTNITVYIIILVRLIMNKINDVMSQELYVSLNNLIKICNDPNPTPATSLRVYGSYNVVGDIFAISKITYPKVHFLLYWNNTNKKFFIVKKYASGKYYIEFLENVANDEPLDLSFGFGLTELANCEGPDGITHHLYFDYDEKKFVFISSSGHTNVFNISYS